MAQYASGHYFYREAHLVIKRGLGLLTLVFLVIACITGCGEEKQCGQINERVYIDCENDRTSTQPTTTTSRSYVSYPQRTTTTSVSSSTTTATPRTTQETVTVLPPTTITVLPPSTVTATSSPVTQAPRTSLSISPTATIIRCGAEVHPGNPFTHGNLTVSLDRATNTLSFSEHPQAGVIDALAVRITDMTEEYPEGYELPLDQALIGTGTNQSLDFQINIGNLDYVLLCT